VVGPALLLALLSVGIVVLLIAMGLLLVQHSGTATTTTGHVTATATTQPVKHPTATPKPVATRTPTPTQLTTCAALPTFANASSATTNSRHFTLPFIANSLSVSAGPDSETNGYQHRTLQLCTPNLTASNLPSALNNILVGSGWVSTASQPSPNDADCGPTCWKLTMPAASASSGGAYTQFVSLGQAQTSGSVVTYPLELTIAPFTSGTHTISKSDPYFSFALTPASDIQFVAPGQIQLLDAALYAPIPGNDFAATYPQIQLLSYTNHQGTPIALKSNASIAFQGNAGVFAKFLVLNSSDSAITFQWITYPYGF
jgi:hypothetical protein